eukprot:TRINITY_DN13690_c0_g1_i2.p1 TRINITY_DN13690_c0_g1~~TRINITY_DN13690_c0_g1_i2.p1  ORF type:complete len:264 (+),score=17.23 TRINITY_DN13690_c0_g1_i2:813-1604(+)
MVRALLCSTGAPRLWHARYAVTVHSACNGNGMRSALSGECARDGYGARSTLRDGDGACYFSGFAAAMTRALLRLHRCSSGGGGEETPPSTGSEHGSEHGCKQLLLAGRVALAACAYAFLTGDAAACSALGGLRCAGGTCLCSFVGPHRAGGVRLCSLGERRCGCGARLCSLVRPRRAGGVMVSLCSVGGRRCSLRRAPMLTQRARGGHDAHSARSGGRAAVMTHALLCSAHGGCDAQSAFSGERAEAMSRALLYARDGGVCSF